MRKFVLDAYIFYRILSISMFLPKKFCDITSKFIGSLLYFICKKTRLAVIDNIKYIKEWNDDKKVKKLAIKTFQNYSKCIVDYYRAPLINRKNLLSNFFELIGGENIEESLKKKKGIILAAIHFGNWDLGGIFLSLLGYPINLVVLSHREERLNRIKNSIREEKGIKIIAVGNTMFSLIEMISVLNRNEIIGILSDHILEGKEGEKGVKVRFLNGYAEFPQGPIMLSLVSEAPIVPCFLIYDAKQKKYKAIAEKPIHIEKTGDRNTDIKQNLVKLTKVFEKYIREYPDQWYSFFPFCTKT